MSSLSAWTKSLLNMLITIFFILLLFCLVASFFNKVSRQNFLFIYFSLVVFVELGCFFTILPRYLYHATPLLYIAFFIFYYKNQKYSNKNGLYMLGVISLFLCIYFYQHQGFKEYSIAVGTVMSFTYILMALQWLWNQLMHTDQNSILKKQAFWVSTSLLVWAVFFLFRLIPMYWLDINDNFFLRQIDVAYQIITIFSYGLFLRSLFCKI